MNKPLVLTFLLIITATIASAQGSPDNAIQLNEENLHWTDAGPNLPMGAKIAVLEGDPKSPGMFTIRIKMPAGTFLRPHTHPREERVTVLDGWVTVAFGETTNWGAGRIFTGGDFYINPPGEAHYVWTTTGATVQITGTGPWEIHFLH